MLKLIEIDGTWINPAQVTAIRPSRNASEDAKPQCFVQFNGMGGNYDDIADNDVCLNRDAADVAHILMGKRHA